MARFYQNEDSHLVLFDCIILIFKDNAIHVLVIKRKFELLKGECSLMGGFIQENESLSNTVSHVLYEYTGIENVY
jgi:ADP-ribose pyrophosphatase YjhB (NUDIX family)